MLRKGYRKDVAKAERRRVNPHYKFTNKHIPLISVAGLSLGVMSLVALVLEIVLTYNLGGTAPLGYGITTIVCLVFSIAGFVCSLRGRLQPDTYLYFSTIGMVINAINVFWIIYLLGRGIMAM